MFLPFIYLAYWHICMLLRCLFRQEYQCNTSLNLNTNLRPTVRNIIDGNYWYTYALYYLNTFELSRPHIVVIYCILLYNLPLLNEVILHFLQNYLLRINVVQWFYVVMILVDRMLMVKFYLWCLRLLQLCLENYSSCLGLELHVHDVVVSWKTQGVLDFHWSQ